MGTAGEDQTEARMTIVRLILLTLTLGAGFVRSTSAQDFTQETQAQRDARMAWWREARFGMFIHWGAYAVPAGTYRGTGGDRTGEVLFIWSLIPTPLPLD